MRKERKTIVYTCDKIGCKAEIVVTVEHDDVGPLPNDSHTKGWFQCGKYVYENHFCPEHAGPYIEYDRAIKERNRKRYEFVHSLIESLEGQFDNDNPAPIFPSL